MFIIRSNIFSWQFIERVLYVLQFEFIFWISHVIQFSFFLFWNCLILYHYKHIFSDTISRKGLWSRFKFKFHFFLFIVLNNLKCKKLDQIVQGIRWKHCRKQVQKFYFLCKQYSNNFVLHLYFYKSFIWIICSIFEIIYYLV